jgi:hypothetical protein
MLLLDSCNKTVKPSAEILGIRLGITKDEADKRLQKIGTLEKEERKQQEVWTLSNDQPYSHLIVSYNKEYTSLRFVTAVAKEKQVRYSDVIDTKKARLTTSGANHTYDLEVEESEGNPAYFVKAIGNDPEFLKYYSIEKKE